MSRTVTTIPATRPVNGPAEPEKTKKKVAAYARVSTDSEEQQTSYTAQVKYYKEYIQNQSDWEYVDVYTDEGITGTSIKHREGFKKMIADALAGKIDLIITKSVSRFARNTVDSLTAIRKLKAAGVEVYFEKENIYTFDGKGEVMLTIMASLAQEESRSISENTTWGQRKRFADGKASVAFGNFLGYDRGENGEFIVNPEQAAVVRKIYGLFLEGKTYRGIANWLTDNGYPTPSGKEKWGSATVKSILSNEKYRGDALLQKSYVSDFLTKKLKKNNGEVPQYYVENNHEAIIDPIVFDEVQAEIKKRGDMAIKGAQRTFTNRIKCGDCGHWYGPKTWHSTSKYKRIVWYCNHKYKGEEKCQTPTLNDEDIQQSFVKALNQILANRETEVANLKEALETSLDTADLEQQLAEREKEYDALVGKGKLLLKKRGENFMQEYELIETACAEKEKQIDELENQIQEKRVEQAKASSFLKLIEKQEPIDKFNDSLFTATVEYATVLQNKDICFKFKEGTEVTISA